MIQQPTNERKEETTTTMQQSPEEVMREIRWRMEENDGSESTNEKISTEIHKSAPKAQ